MLHDAIEDCIEFEGCGCPISENTFTNITKKFEGCSEPRLYEDTTSYDFSVAKKVQEICLGGGACTLHDYEELLNGDLSDENITLEQLGTRKKPNVDVSRTTSLSENATKLIEDSAKASSREYRLMEDKKNEIRNDVMAFVDRMLNDERVSGKDVSQWHKKFNSIGKELYEKIEQKFGVNGGGEGVKVWASTSTREGAPMKKRFKGLTG